MKITNFTRRYNFYYIFVYIALLVTYIITYHIQYNDIRLPYFDGSHHFSELINYTISLGNEPFRAIISLWQSSPELFLSYTLISVFNNILFIDRNIITVIYILLLLFLFISVYTLTDKTLKKTLIVFTFLVTSTILISNTGGLLDSRIDVISILLFSISLIMLLQGKFYNSLLMIMLASFFKSSMIFLAFPVILYLTYKIFVGIKQININNIIKIIVILCLIYIYIDSILLKSISYNLMSTGGSGAGNSLLLYINKIYLYLSQDFLFYGKYLIQDAFFSLSFIYIFINLFFIEDKANKKLIIMYILFFLWTYFLLTSNPLHERVLLIWFYPVYLFGILVIFKLNKKYYVNFFILFIIFFIQISAIIINNKYPQEWKQEYYYQATQNIKEQSKELSVYLDKEQNNSDTIIFVNFLSNHGPVSYNYDVYRVLLHENLKYSRKIYGWELSTYSENWKDEFKKYIVGMQKIILILQEEPMGIPQDNNPQRYGKDIYNSFVLYASSNKECVRKVAKDITLPHIKTRSIYEFLPSKKCLISLENFKINKIYQR